MLITPFDPWKSTFCTCPPKLTLNPYTGCSHRCLYCYVSSYIPHFFQCRPKQNLIRRLEREADKLKGELISIANSSDPYPSLEATLKLTRQSLQVLAKHPCRIQLVTKSPLVTRDISLLKSIPSMVSISITTTDPEVAKMLEPAAPPPIQRLRALEELIRSHVPTSARVDPIIPFLNDEPQHLIQELSRIGVPHVTCSTYKAKPDNWKRMAAAFPALAPSWEPLYFREGERVGRSLYLSRETRLGMMKQLKELIEREGMQFSCCREGFPELNSATCDGSWLLNPAHRR